MMRDPAIHVFKCFQEFRCGLRFAVQNVVSKRSHQEKRMSSDGNISKQVIHDKLESQIKTAEAKLQTLKAQAETAKANVEIKAIGALLPETKAIRQKLQELKKSGGDRWEQAKGDLEGRIADFEKSVKRIESKAS
jgi:hypothetical protein